MVKKLYFYNMIYKKKQKSHKEIFSSMYRQGQDLPQTYEMEMESFAITVNDFWRYVLLQGFPS